MKNTAQTTRTIKKHLKEIFGINAKVSSKSYAGGSSIRIKYRGGCNPELVEKALTGIEYGSFDGMQDLYEYNKSEFMIKGERLQQFKYAFVTREISDEFFLRLAQFYSSRVKFADIHECKTEADFDRNFNTHFSGAWNWRQFIRNISQNINLITDNLEAIEFLDVFSTGNWEIGFLYEYNGKAYSTMDAPEFEGGK